MASLPHDLPDVLLAPMVLRVDARLAELGELDTETLRRRIASDTNNGASTTDRITTSAGSSRR